RSEPGSRSTGMVLSRGAGGVEGGKGVRTTNSPQGSQPTRKDYHLRLGGRSRGALGKLWGSFPAARRPATSVAAKLPRQEGRCGAVKRGLLDREPCLIQAPEEVVGWRRAGSVAHFPRAVLRDFSPASHSFSRRCTAASKSRPARPRKW